MRGQKCTDRWRETKLSQTWEYADARRNNSSFRANDIVVCAEISHRRPCATSSLGGKRYCSIMYAIILPIFGNEQDQSGHDHHTNQLWRNSALSCKEMPPQRNATATSNVSCVFPSVPDTKTQSIRTRNTPMATLPNDLCDVLELPPASAVRSADVVAWLPCWSLDPTSSCKSLSWAATIVAQCLTTRDELLLKLAVRRLFGAKIFGTSTGPNCRMNLSFSCNFAAMLRQHAPPQRCFEVLEDVSPSRVERPLVKSNTKRASTAMFIFTATLKNIKSRSPERQLKIKNFSFARKNGGPRSKSQ